MKKILAFLILTLIWPSNANAIYCVDKNFDNKKKIVEKPISSFNDPLSFVFRIDSGQRCRSDSDNGRRKMTKVGKNKYKKLFDLYKIKRKKYYNKFVNKKTTKLEKISDNSQIVSTSATNLSYSWNGKLVSKNVYCNNAKKANMPLYYPKKFHKLCVELPEIEKKKIAEEKKLAEEKRIAEVKKLAEQKRIAEEKRIQNEKKKKEQEYRILVKKYGDDCKDNSLGSTEFNKCLKEEREEDLLQAKLQREFLASLTPEEARAYTCNNTFGFKKGSSNFKDCIFKLYTTELELEKLDLEKQLALAKVEAEKAKADTARAQVEIIQARSAAARAEGKLQEAQIQATKAQTLIMQQQAAAAKQQAAAAQAQAKAAQQQNSINLMTQGLKMLSGNQSSTRLRTNCTWSSIGIRCR